MSSISWVRAGKRSASMIRGMWHDAQRLASLPGAWRVCCSGRWANAP
jgi:hypothetical protein